MNVANLKILYRGHLKDCNYACAYCPFSKTRSDASEQELDARDLERFVDWVGGNGGGGRGFEIFMTPFGEALVRPWYRRAVVRLSRMPHVAKVAIQTNLGWDPRWLEDCDPKSTALWTTYHPEFTTQAAFLERLAAIDRMGIPCSVGVVGTREHMDAIVGIRQSLPEHAYLWVNAYKRVEDYYSEPELRLLREIDPLFPANLPRYESRGHACRTGLEVLAVEGNGDVARCHFVKERRGNIFVDDLDSMLFRSSCPSPTCHCHIGYVHLERLGLDRVYGSGILERIPEGYRHGIRQDPVLPLQQTIAQEASEG